MPAGAARLRGYHVGSPTCFRLDLLPMDDVLDERHGRVRLFVSDPFQMGHAFRSERGLSGRIDVAQTNARIPSQIRSLSSLRRGSHPSRLTAVTFTLADGDALR
jgi:hypothetical protein